jgi:hypothetical protein
VTYISTHARPSSAADVTTTLDIRRAAHPQFLAFRLDSVWVRDCAAGAQRRADLQQVTGKEGKVSGSGVMGKRAVCCRNVALLLCLHLALHCYVFRRMFAILRDTMTQKYKREVETSSDIYNVECNNTGNAL